MGAGQVPQHVFNRRWFLKDGKTATNPFGEQDRAVMNPGSFRNVLDRPAGPTNPEVYFISVQSADGRPIALLAITGCTTSAVLAQAISPPTISLCLPIAFRSHAGVLDS